MLQEINFANVENTSKNETETNSKTDDYGCTGVTKAMGFAASDFFMVNASGDLELIKPGHVEILGNRIHIVDILSYHTVVNINRFIAMIDDGEAFKTLTPEAVSNAYNQYYIKQAENG